VQEQPGTVWKKPTYASITDAFGGAIGLTFRFTDWASLVQEIPHLYTPGSEPQVLRDCQFHGGQLVIYAGFQMTNCVLDRVYSDLEPMNSPCYTRNCTVFGGTFVLSPFTSNAQVSDTLFDGVTIPNYIDGSGLTYIGGFNAYVTGKDRLQPALTTDIILTAPPPYQTGPLGNYYQLNTSPLFNADNSTTASQVGLYHYTTATNLLNGLEVKEGTTYLDVGFHYVATDAFGNPTDSDRDGLADYLEDVNGDGAVSSGETDWNNPDTDADGLSDGYEELISHTDPLAPNASISGTLNVQACPP
jgi:hypothetical protein